MAKLPVVGSQCSRKFIVATTWGIHVTMSSGGLADSPLESETFAKRFVMNEF